MKSWQLLPESPAPSSSPNIPNHVDQGWKMMTNEISRKHNWFWWGARNVHSSSPVWQRMNFSSTHPHSAWTEVAAYGFYINLCDFPVGFRLMNIVIYYFVILLFFSFISPDLFGIHPLEGTHLPQWVNPTHHSKLHLFTNKIWDWHFCPKSPWQETLRFKCDVICVLETHFWNSAPHKCTHRNQLYGTHFSKCLCSQCTPTTFYRRNY